MHELNRNPSTEESISTTHALLFREVIFCLADIFARRKTDLATVLEVASRFERMMNASSIVHMGTERVTTRHAPHPVMMSLMPLVQSQKHIQGGSRGR